MYKILRVMLTSCALTVAALTSSGCIGAAGDDADSVETGVQDETISAHTIAALLPSESLSIDLRSDARFTFDSTQGPLDLSRIRVTDLSGRTAAMSQWLEQAAPALSAHLPPVFELTGHPVTGVSSGGTKVSTQGLTIIYIYIRDSNGNVIGWYTVVRNTPN